MTTSQDFQNLMKKIYSEKYRIISTKFSFSERKTHAKVTLQKDSDIITLESSQDNFCIFLVHVKRVVDKTGEFTLVKLRDTELYYKDVEFLIDEDKKKIRDAVERVRTGKSQLDFDPNIELDRLLFEKYGKHDDKIIKLKTNFYEVLAVNLMETNNFNTINERKKKIDPKYSLYSDLIEEALRKAFMSTNNAVKNYRLYKKYLNFNLTNLVQCSLTQKDFVDDLFKMLIARVKIEGEVGIKYLLDLYRRYCELSFDMLNLVRIGIDLINGVKEPKQRLPSVKNVNIINNDVKYAEIVECVRPLIRHSESHVSTKIEKDKVLLTDRKNKNIGTFTFKEISDLTRNILNSFYPALIITFVLFDALLRTLVYQSPEYKGILIGLNR